MRDVRFSQRSCWGGFRPSGMWRLVAASRRFGVTWCLHIEGQAILRFCVVWRERTLRAGTHYLHVTWAHVMLRVQLGCERRFNTEFYEADSHFCHSAYVTWSHVEVWSAHAPARLSHFCCRTHFVMRDQRVECSLHYITKTQSSHTCHLISVYLVRARVNVRDYLYYS